MFCKANIAVGATVWAAEALKLDAPDRVQKRGCSVSTRQNEDGTVTFVANISAKVGLEIIIR